MDLIHTANQPIGPFFHFALTPDNAGACLAGPDAKGERIQLACRILDRDGKPVTNAMVELWQADGAGKYNHPADTQEKAPDPSFRGFGRLASDEHGLCVFHTVRPGRVPGWSGVFQAPHINVSVYTPGLLRRVVTRIYYADEPANDADQVLGMVPEDRRPTLMARRGVEPGEWTFD